MEPSTSGNGDHGNSHSQRQSETTMKTYANVIAPKKEEAIIIDSMEGLSNDDYLWTDLKK